MSTFKKLSKKRNKLRLKLKKRSVTKTHKNKVGGVKESKNITEPPLSNADLIKLALIKQLKGKNNNKKFYSMIPNNRKKIYNNIL